MFNDVHLEYQRKTVGEHRMDRLARNVNKLSKYLWDIQKLYPFEFPEFRELALKMRDMATGLQTGPRRKLYYTMPYPVGYDRHGRPKWC